MSNIAWLFTAALPICILCGRIPATAHQPPRGLDPEIKAELMRRIEKGDPNLSKDAKEEILQRIEATPKIKCQVESVSVYRDGIVCTATIASELPFDCRLSYVGRSLSLVCRAKLIDGANNEWGVTRLTSHYDFANLTEAQTLLIPQGKGVRFTQVDSLEEPRLVRLRPSTTDKAAQPNELNYTLLGFTSAHSSDLKKRNSVYLIGKGKTPVEWKDVSVPSDWHSVVAHPPRNLTK
jgi:hypothetical protein